MIYFIRKKFFGPRGSFQNFRIICEICRALKHELLVKQYIFSKTINFIFVLITIKSQIQIIIFKSSCIKINLYPVYRRIQHDRAYSDSKLQHQQSKHVDNAHTLPIPKLKIQIHAIILYQSIYTINYSDRCAPQPRARHSIDPSLPSTKGARAHHLSRESITEFLNKEFLNKSSLTRVP